MSNDIIEIRFPEDSEGTKATLSSWLKNPGDAVSQHEPVAEVETDKVMMEVSAPADGVIDTVCVEPGTDVSPGDVLAKMRTGSLDDDAQGRQEKASEKSAASGGIYTPVDPLETVHDAGNRPPLSPAVRRLCLEKGVTADTIAGSGRGGRVTARDVEAHAANAPSAMISNTEPSKPMTPATDMGQFSSSRVPHDQMRKAIADHMVGSLLHTAPHVTSVFEADMSAVIRHRKTRKAEYAQKGAKLTMTAYIVQACVKALQEVPEINSRFHEDHLEIFHDLNIGVGTALGNKGLVVPVLHRAQGLSLYNIAARLTDMTDRARNQQLKPEDVRNGTFTISNHGVSGSLFATPIIINQPQSAILGVGKLEKRVKVREVDGQEMIAVVPMCYVSLTIDHRALDAHQTNTFLSTFVATLENWPED